MTWQKIILQQRKKHQNQGFITLEILVSIIIALAFVAFSMQALVLAKMLKVQAQQKQKADQLIQEDIETLNNVANANRLDRRLASILTDNVNICSPTNYDGGYGQALWYAFTNQDYNGDSTYSSTLIDTNFLGGEPLPPDPMDDGDTININPNYEATPTTQLLKTVNADGSITSEGTTLTINRTHISANNNHNNSPYRTLKIYYQVINSNNELVAKRYVEVIPDVALECP